MNEIKKKKVLPTKEIKKNAKARMVNSERPSSEVPLANPRIMDIAFQSLVLSGCIK